MEMGLGVRVGVRGWGFGQRALFQIGQVRFNIPVGGDGAGGGAGGPLPQAPLLLPVARRRHTWSGSGFGLGLG